MPFGFSLEYPENWEITKDKTSCSLDPNTNNEICTGYQLIISLIENPKYSFELDMCSECSPGSICMFSDSDYSDAFLDSSSAYVHRFESFEEFNDGTFRRGVSKEKENDGKLFICKSLNSEEYGNYYHTSILSFIEGIKYTLDENADSQIIEAMDRMVLSLEVIPKP
ncbi:hypothetical protein KBB42_01960 [Candidatus Dojkabacteria bacterium]|nr:hypothetical protein [Candidatus Dojkabacteria bacterium]